MSSVAKLFLNFSLRAAFAAAPDYDGAEYADGRQQKISDAARVSVGMSFFIDFFRNYELLFS